jgi:hypothetical protein
MDATRSRRTRGDARQHWYAAWRTQRFARHLGFATPSDAPRTSPAPAPAYRLLPTVVASSRILSMSWAY